MTHFLKEPTPRSPEATDELQQRVSDLLRDIERGGIDAVRRWSQELDGWAPDSFVVDDAAKRAAADELDDSLKEHIAFAQDQVRRFAQAQRDSLSEVRVEMGPGVVLGHK